MVHLFHHPETSTTTMTNRTQKATRKTVGNKAQEKINTAKAHGTRRIASSINALTSSDRLMLHLFFLIELKTRVPHTSLS
jgi:hypothetical protein